MVIAKLNPSVLGTISFAFSQSMLLLRYNGTITDQQRCVYCAGFQTEEECVGFDTSDGAVHVPCAWEYTTDDGLNYEG